MMATMRMLAVAVILLLASTAGSSRPHTPPSTYILPVLSCGINNQKMDFRQIAAIARVLRMGLLLTGMYQHYTDPEAQQRAQQRFGATQLQSGQIRCFPPRHWGFMDFDLLFDRTPLANWLPVMSLYELRQTGWNGTIDAVVHGADWKPDEVPLNITLKGVGARLVPNAPTIAVKSYLNCEARELTRVKKLLQPYTVVAMYVFGLQDTLYPNLASLHQRTQPDDDCRRNSLVAERILRPSLWVKSIATKFQAEFLHNEEYLAVHIRPYPDACLNAWKTGRLDDASLEVCEPRLRSLHKDVPTKIGAVLARTRLRRLFVMSHPGIRDTIHTLLQQVNLTDVAVAHLDMPTLNRLAGCINYSTSFMSMVEEVIAAQAHSFIGTATSSITRTVVLSRDPSQAHTITWFEHDEPSLGGGLPGQ